MSDPQMIREIQRAVSIPVMAKCRIGHFVEAQILQQLGVDFIDESEVLTPADDVHHVNKWGYQVYMCVCVLLIDTRIVLRLMVCRCRLFAAAVTWGRRCGASARARP